MSARLAQVLTHREGIDFSIMNSKVEMELDKISPYITSALRLKVIWTGMKSRCYNKKSPFYKNYGGRGITICDEWKKFEVDLLVRLVV